MEKKKLIYLDRNENHYGPAPRCFKVLSKPNFNKLSAYSRDFSRGIKSRLSERIALDFGIEESRVLLGYGGEDILKQIVHCQLQKGDKILIPAYSWWYYKAIAEEVEGVKVEYPLTKGINTFYYDVDEMINLVKTEKPKMVLVASPNNPTGNAIDLGDLKRFLDSTGDAVVVVDEAYTVFANPDTSYVKDLVNTYHNLLVVRTFSKYYALAGIRIGFALMGSNLAKFSKFSARYLGYNRLSERIALAALDSDDYYSEMRIKMLDDIDMFFNEFSALPGFTPYKSLANFILVEIPDQIKVPLKNYLLAKGLVIKFMDEDNLRSHVRISIGTQEENRMLMDAVKEFVNS